MPITRRQFWLAAAISAALCFGLLGLFLLVNPGQSPYFIIIAAIITAGALVAALTNIYRNRVK